MAQRSSRRSGNNTSERQGYGWRRCSADFRELDSDNDSILDVIENGIPDTNGDGMVDGFCC